VDNLVEKRKSAVMTTPAPPIVPATSTTEQKATQGEAQRMQRTQSDQQSGKKAKSSRPHVYELDPLRATTALVVVAVHVLAFTAFLNHAQWGLQVQNALVTAVHYTREMFMFVTAFALTYVYFGKPFSTRTFWKKRAIGVLIPYAIWSAVYVWVNNPTQSLGHFLGTAALDILDGHASYQLYYILLTLQFYILLPLFLLLVKVIRRYPWQTLAISFALEVITLYLDYHTLQRGIGLNNPFWNFINQSQESLVFIYQFYFVLGAAAALYLPQLRAFLKRFGWWTLPAFLLGIGGLWLHFYLQVDVYHESIGYAVSVLQPVMVFYCIPLIAFFFWLTYRWASHVRPDGRPHGYRFWGTLSDVSFGVYLVHALILNWLMQHMVPILPTVWPVALRVFLTWGLTAGSAVLICILLMNTPILSRLVGRSRPLPRILLRWQIVLMSSFTRSGSSIQHVQQKHEA
jgi:peptidoglycan/LPS O-acetylase OafA/YrhL